MCCEFLLVHIQGSTFWKIKHPSLILKRDLCSAVTEMCSFCYLVKIWTALLKLGFSRNVATISPQSYCNVKLSLSLSLALSIWGKGESKNTIGSKVDNDIYLGKVFLKKIFYVLKFCTVLVIEGSCPTVQIRWVFLPISG